MNEREDLWMNEWINEWKGGSMNEWMNEREDPWMNGMNGKDGSMNEWIHLLSAECESSSILNLTVLLQSFKMFPWVPNIDQDSLTRDLATKYSIKTDKNRIHQWSGQQYPDPYQLNHTKNTNGIVNTLLLKGL